MCCPRYRMKYLEAIERTTASTKTPAPRRLHHWPWTVPGTRRMKATLLPVSSPLAGHITTWSRKKATTNSISAAAARQTRICAIETRKPSTVWPRIWSVKMTAATWSRGSARLGSRTG